MSHKLTSLTIFFPFYNDEGTVLKQIDDAYNFGEMFTDDLEVIALHGGASKDQTYSAIETAKLKHPSLKIVDKKDNTEGYAVIKHGFFSATKDWVFYTDGDAQYHLDDLSLLIFKQKETNADIVNGYKIKRGDNLIRVVIGNLYALFSTFIFDLAIRDTDCDFRLIRKKYLDKIKFLSTDSSILAELIKKLELEGAKFAEVPVRHYERVYGVSNYTPLLLFKEKLMGDITLYFKLKKYNPLEKLRIFKFAFVGILSIAIQFVYFNLFLLNFPNPGFIELKFVPALYAILADQIAIVGSFLLNNHITFTDRKVSYNKGLFERFAKLYVIIMVSTLIQAIVIYIGTHLFGDSLIVSNIFFMLGTAIGFFWNYSFQKRFVYKR